MKTGVSAIDESTAPLIAGSDECGYGAWAGPLTVAVVVVPRGWIAPAGLTDSKKMSATSMRKARDTFLAGKGTWHRVAFCFAEDIDRIGVYSALYGLHTRLMQEAFAAAKTLGEGEVLAIVDGDLAIEGCHHLPKADLLVPAVSMASVLGKLARDEHMAEMDMKYPGYGFASHVGYGTPPHQEALRRLGPCPIHRRSYRPIADLVRVAEEPKEAWVGLEEEEDPSAPS